MHLSPSRRRLYARRLALAVGVVLTVTAVFSLPDIRRGQEDVASRLAAATVFTDGSVAERLALWKRSLSMIGDRPLLGVGPGHWRIQHASAGLKGMRSEDGLTFYQRPHNDYLWIGSESGVIPMAAYAAVMLLAAAACVRCLRLSTDKDDLLTAAAVLFGIIAWSVISAFCFPRERVVHLVLSALLVSSAWMLETKTTPRVAGGRSRARLIGLAALLLGLVGAGVSWERLKSERHVALALDARQRGDWAGVVREIDAAESSFMPMDPTATPLVWYRGVGRFSMGHLESALRDFEKAYRINPLHIHVLNNLAACHERRESHAEAVRYYQKSLDIAPGYVETRINLAACYSNWGKHKEALEVLLAAPDSTHNARLRPYRKQIEDRQRDEDVNPSN